MDALDTKTSKEEGVFDDVPTPGPLSPASADDQSVDRKALIKQITDMLKEPGLSHTGAARKPLAAKKGSRAANADLIKLLNANSADSPQRFDR